MPDINLLPWRETARMQRKRKWIIFSVLVLLILIVISGAIYFAAPSSAPPSEKSPLLVDRQSEKQNKLLKQLKFAGFLAQKQQRWGLLMLPNGKTQDVRAGSRLPLVRAKVLSVDEDQIVLVLEDGRQFVVKSP